MLNPVAQDDDARLTRKHEVEHDVTMTEDEEIGRRMLLHVLLGKKHLMLLVLAEEVGIFATRGAAMGTPTESKSSGKVGMNPAEHALAHRAIEETGHPLEGHRVVSQAMTVSQIAGLALNGEQATLPMDDGARLLLDIIEDPDVVIARKPMHLDA